VGSCAKELAWLKVLIMLWAWLCSGVGRSVDWCGLGLLIDLTTSHGWAFYVVWFDCGHL